MAVEILPDDVERLASQGLSTKHIAHCLGVARSTLYERRKKDKDISDALKRGRAKGLETITNALFESGKGGNVTSMIFYLKNRDPENWQDRRNTEITGKDGGPIGLLPFEFVDADDS